MIEYIKGTVDELTPTYIVVEAGGVGYQLNITLNCYTRLEGAKQVKMLAHEIIREDAHLLYGFLEERERELFRQLIGVSGVGANTARMILSAIPSSELGSVIASGNLARLKGVKGIGSKTAQRIIVDLKDKINVGDDALLVQSIDTSEVQEEAMAALVMLGFSRQQSSKALKKIFESTPDIKVENAIKQALAMM